MLNIIRNQIDKIIITAMDRFVWFVLLVVMSHLVTEFTRVTGYARGTRNDVVLLNDSLIQSMPVQNMVLYPGDEYGLFERPSYSDSSSSSSSGGGDSSSSSSSNNNNNPKTISAFFLPSTGNNEQNGGGITFSFRPLIDSIFEIPISTLRAVNNLVARLTGSYRQAPSTLSSSSGNSNSNIVEKSFSGMSRHGDEPTNTNNIITDATSAKMVKRQSVLREKSA